MKLIKILNALTRIITLILVLVIVLFVFVASNYDSSSATESGPQLKVIVDPEPDETFTDDPGYQLFTEWGCKNCHRVNRKLVGPALAGVTERRERDWIYRFIKNSTKMIEEGDPIAVALYNEYNQHQMQSHELENEQIDLILSYIEKASK